MYVLPFFNFFLFVIIFSPGILISIWRIVFAEWLIGVRIANLGHTTDRIWTCAEPEFTSCAVVHDANIEKNQLSCSLNKDPRISFKIKFSLLENKNCQNIRNVYSGCNSSWLKIMKLIIMQREIIRWYLKSKWKSNNKSIHDWSLSMNFFEFPLSANWFSWKHNNSQICKKDNCL